MSAACPLCAEPLPAGAARCPTCEAPRRRPSALRALLLVSVGCAGVVGLLVGGLALAEAVKGSPWSEFPVTAPLFDPTAPLPTAPSPYARAGERWTFREDEGRVEVTWRVVAAQGAEVRYEVSRTDEAGAGGSGLATGASRSPVTWSFGRLDPPIELTAVTRETLDVAGRKIECLVVDIDDGATMMNHFERRVWVAVVGDTPVFPGVVRREARNQGTTWVEWEAADVSANEPPSTPGR